MLHACNRERRKTAFLYYEAPIDDGDSWIDDGASALRSDGSSAGPPINNPSRQLVVVIMLGGVIDD